MHKGLQEVSTKELIRVRRLAARSRAALACARCKNAKIRCTDNRPCKKCAISNLECHEVKKVSRLASHVAPINLSGVRAHSLMNPAANFPLLLEMQSIASTGEANENKTFTPQMCSVHPNPLKADFIDGANFHEQNQFSVQPRCARPPSANDWNAVGSRLDLMQSAGGSTPALDSGIHQTQIPASTADPGTTAFLPAMRIQSSLFNANDPPEICVPAMRNLPSSSTFLHRDAMLPHRSPNLQLPFPAILLSSRPFPSPAVPPLTLLQCLHWL
jgi:hypothetical protein